MMVSSIQFFYAEVHLSPFSSIVCTSRQLVIYYVVFPAGAISVFMGVTRDNFEGKRVTRLEYEAYEEMATKVTENAKK